MITNRNHRLRLNFCLPCTTPLSDRNTCYLCNIILKEHASPIHSFQQILAVQLYWENTFKHTTLRTGMKQSEVNHRYCLGTCWNAELWKDPEKDNTFLRRQTHCVGLLHRYLHHLLQSGKARLLFGRQNEVCTSELW